MGTEIERKFLIVSGAWKSLVTEPSVRIRQGYLSSVKERTVRVRVAGAEAFITVKGVTVGATRQEFEYAIPLADAEAMLDSLCEPAQIDKTRHRVEHSGVTFEVDVFHGDNAGLVVAEVELADEHQQFARPEWLGGEVTHDPRYYNSNLAETPVSRWKKSAEAGTNSLTPTTPPTPLDWEDHTPQLTVPFDPSKIPPEVRARNAALAKEPRANVVYRKAPEAGR